MKVGDTIWVFDDKRRVYPPRRAGQYSGAPIYREKWEARTIIGETSRSWLLGPSEQHPLKVPKGKDIRGVVLNLEQVEQDVYIHDNRHKLSDEVSRCNDFEKLKAIESLLRS